MHIALRCAPDLIPQGVAAELIAAKWGFSRAQLDEFAASSHERAALALLARMSADEGCARIGEERYAAVEARLESVRKSGSVALVRDSLGPGVSAIAAAVSDRSGTVVGAVNISGLRLEEHLDPASDVAREVGRTATSIMGALQ